jgi:hypothetical protein
VLFLVIVALVAVIAAAVGAPLLAPGRDVDASRARARAALEARKEAKYREIRDAEVDYRTGKLSREDYKQLDRQLRREAIEILRELDELGDVPPGP